MGRVEGKVALVTGGAGGIGGAIAQRLAENGARLVLTDRSRAGLDEMVSALAKRGVQDVLALEHDVASERDWQKVMEAVGRAHPRLDVAVNAAGIFSSKGQPFDAIPLEEWRRILTVNLEGTFLGTRFAVEAMKQTGGGAIVNIASTAAYLGTRAGAAYGASKAGVRALTVQAAVSCAAHGYNIRINSISPGYVLTPTMEAKMVADFGSREAGMTVAAGRNPLGRVAVPDDVAWAAVYLASEEARMINAFDLVIDGGMRFATQVK